MPWVIAGRTHGIQRRPFGASTAGWVTMVTRETRLHSGARIEIGY